jgi:hypothetical protein
VDSYADYLQPFLACIPPSLVPEECLRDVLGVAEHLPAALGTRPFFLECPLDDRSTADFGVGFSAVDSYQGALMRLAPQVDRFMDSWADTSSLLGRTVEEIWLEFDVGSPRAGHTPSVFFGSPRPAGIAQAGQPDEQARAAEEGLALLMGKPASSMLAECFSALPGLGRIQFLGAMLSRDSHAVRVIASGRSLADMVHYLQRLGFSRPLRPLVSDVADLTDHVWLAVDVDDGGVGPRVGFECYLDAVTPLENGGRWAALLDFLVKRGACIGTKRDALLGITDLSGGGGWAAGPRNIATILGPAGLGVMWLFLHHVKVTDRPGARLEAKAYLCGGYA